MTTPRTPSTSRFANVPMTEDAANTIIEQDTGAPERKITATFNASVGRFDQTRNLFYALRNFTDEELAMTDAELRAKPAAAAKFRRLDVQVIAEYRSMMGKGTSRAPLTEAERAEIADIRRQAREQVAKHPGIALEAAESLCFAAKIVGIDHDQYIQRLIDTNGNIFGLDPETVMRASPFKFDVNHWLYALKTHGADHGLGYFADKINLTTTPSGSVTVSVDDPAVLREIVAMRNNPRLSAVLGAETLKDGETNVPRIQYRGVNYNSDPEVMDNQQALIALGFDIGNRRADGVNGPLTSAATREFMQIKNITDPAQVHGQLQAALSDAQNTAGRYVYNPAQRDFVRQSAASRAPADGQTAIDLSTKDAFALRIASERSGKPFQDLLGITIAERAFERGPRGSNRSPGLFHISDGQWLMTVAQHGEKYGLGDLVRQMRDVRRDANGKVTNVTIADPALREYILNLRNDPRISALMGAERAKEYPIQLDIAETYLGMTENQNKRTLENFFRTQGQISHDPVDLAWCAVFVNTVLRSAGHPGTNGQTMARSFVNEGYGQAAVSGNQLSAARSERSPARKQGMLNEIARSVRPGDIIVFPRTDDPVKGHVGFVTDVFKGADGRWRVKVLGGNQGGERADGGGVTSQDFLLETAVGIRRPPPGRTMAGLTNQQQGPAQSAPTPA